MQMSDNLMERVARAIAASRRGLSVDDPEIDRVWSGYGGCAKAAMAECNNWQPIETAPKDGRWLLLHRADINITIVAQWDDESEPGYDWLTLDGPHYCDTFPTHWMPLPEPPK